MMNKTEVLIREKTCYYCPAPCTPRPDLTDPAATCPLDRFYPRVVTSRVRGLGDVVAIGLSPVVAVIDAVAHTDLKNCKGCGGRIAALNKRFPNKSHAKN